MITGWFQIVVQTGDERTGSLAQMSRAEDAAAGGADWRRRDVEAVDEFGKLAPGLSAELRATSAGDVGGDTASGVGLRRVPVPLSDVTTTQQVLGGVQPSIEVT